MYPAGFPTIIYIIENVTIMGSIIICSFSNVPCHAGTVTVSCNHHVSSTADYDMWCTLWKLPLPDSFSKVIFWIQPLKAEFLNLT